VSATDEPTDVPPEDNLHQLKEAYLMCRSFGHAWRLAHRGQLADSQLWSFILSCRSCRTKREDVVTQRGGVVHRHYDYPEGYLRPGHTFIRDEYRYEIVFRTKGDGS
jgi:hypothetical protein